MKRGRGTRNAPLSNDELNALRSALPDGPPSFERLNRAIDDLQKGTLDRKQRASIIDALDYLYVAMFPESNAPRGLSRLYREARTLLAHKGADTSAHLVRLALKAAGVVHIEADVLHWSADNGKPQKTTFKQFETGLSRHRKDLRKK